MQKSPNSIPRCTVSFCQVISVSRTQQKSDQSEKYIWTGDKQQLVEEGRKEFFCQIHMLNQLKGSVNQGHHNQEEGTHH